jgi:two-component sensor histidine kinase
MGNNHHFLARRADGLIFPVDVMLSPLIANNDTFVIATVRDVTQLQQNEEKINAALREKETLLKELYHRVKNNLQVVASMMNLQERAISDQLARAALQEAAGRVRAMALVHEKLYQSRNLSVIALDDYVSTICKQLGEVADAARRGIKIASDVQQIEAGIEEAIPLGIVLNELISNSLKHAFPAGRPGRIVIKLACEDGEMLRLTVSDDGVGYPEGFTPASTRSLGLKLTLALASQLGGRFSISNQGGAVATLEFPYKEHSS